MQRILQTLSLSFSDYTLQPLQTSFFFTLKHCKPMPFFFQTETLLPTRSAAANGGTTLVPPIRMATYEWQQAHLPLDEDTETKVVLVFFD